MNYFGEGVLNRDLRLACSIVLYRIRTCCSFCSVFDLFVLVFVASHDLLDHCAVGIVEGGITLGVERRSRRVACNIGITAVGIWDHS